ncbi:hypothetical protein Tco_1015861 [Tanacetum coccineum]|uniref:Uncharacterized protein n=1 Tax=Tanacetum coccineum TaxID=301880 RepID=A0ABQ5FM43_9ASTR
MNPLSNPSNEEIPEDVRWIRCARTELITPDLTCPSKYQLLRNSSGDSGPDLSFDKSASLKRLFSLAHVSLAEASKLDLSFGWSGGDYTSSCPPNLVSAKACSFMLCDLDFEPLTLSLTSMPSCDLESLTNILILCLILKASNQTCKLDDVQQCGARLPPIHINDLGVEMSIDIVGVTPVTMRQVFLVESNRLTGKGCALHHWVP